MSALLTPSRRAESWLPLIRITRAPVARSRASASSYSATESTGGGALVETAPAAVDVAGDEHGVPPLGPCRLNEMIEEAGLRLPQVGPVKRAPEMPVRGM